MENNIYKNPRGTKLIIEIPFFVDRYNPYDPAGTIPGTMENIVGVICGDEVGFAYQIDMDYKGKGDQIGSTFYHYDGTEKEFKDLCEKLNIYLYKYPVCTHCKQVMYGSFTMKDGKDVCMPCGDKMGT